MVDMMTFFVDMRGKEVFIERKKSIDSSTIKAAFRGEVFDVGADCVGIRLDGEDLYIPFDAILLVSPQHGAS